MSLETFIEEGFVPPEKPVYLSDEEYSRALSTFVVGCSDVIGLCEGKLFFAKRKAEPISDWWMIGGRMQFGETPEKSAARCFKRETGLDFKPEDFKKFAAYIVVLKMRAQEPQNAGAHYITVVHALKVEREQIESFKLDKEEYTGETMLLLPDEVVTMADSGKLHPAFKMIVRDLKASGLVP